MVTLKQLAYDTLSGVNIYISAPYNYSGNVFNEGETAFVEVKIKNITGLPLRDVVVNISASGAITIAPVIFPFPGAFAVLFDGQESWDEIKPYRTKKFLVRLKGKYSGNGYLRANICAEIVPFSCRHRATRSVIIYQD